MSDYVYIGLLNKAKPNRPIYLKILPTIDMYNVKKRLLSFFSEEIRQIITGFRLVRSGPPEDNINDTISENYFDDKYDDFDAYAIFKKIKKIYKSDFEKNPLIYFRVIKTKLNVNPLIAFPLAYENNSFSKLISDIGEQIRPKVEIKYHIFQNTPKLDEVNQEIDMKRYSKTGLVVYLFPILVRFVDLATTQKTTVVSLSSNYLSKIANQRRIEQLFISIS